MRRGAGLGWFLAAAAGALAASGAALAAAPEDRTCVARRPASLLPSNFKPLFVNVAVPCAEASDAERRALVGHPPATTSAPAKAIRPVHPHLNYYGGPVISNVEVVALRWNASVPTDYSAAKEDFYRTFTRSAMFDWLSEYDTVGLTGLADGLPGSEQRIGHGTLLGTYTLTPAVRNTGPFVTPSQIADELVAHVAAGAIPPPGVDAQGHPTRVYMIDFPDGVAIKAGKLLSCVDYCAFHASTRVAGLRAPYAVLPAVAGGCLSGCAARGEPFAVATVNASHELVESVTDPAISEVPGVLDRPAAWYDPQPNQDEIADICELGPDELLDGYWVQLEWSNRRRACIADPPPTSLAEPKL